MNLSIPFLIIGFILGCIVTVKYPATVKEIYTIWGGKT